MPSTIESLSAIRGATSLLELAHLHHLARQLRDGCIVEIGAWQGRSTAALALGARDGAGVAVYTIDPHEPFTGVLGGTFGPGDRAEFFRNMVDHGVAELVRLLSVSSEIVTPGWTAPVGLLWIDGDHRYEGVRRDVDCWRPHLMAGATVVFDDAEVEGPRRVIDEQIAAGWTMALRVGKTATLTLPIT